MEGFRPVLSTEDFSFLENDVDQKSHREKNRKTSTADVTSEMAGGSSAAPAEKAHLQVLRSLLLLGVDATADARELSTELLPTCAGWRQFVYFLLAGALRPGVCDQIDDMLFLFSSRPPGICGSENLEAVF